MATIKRLQRHDSMSLNVKFANGQQFCVKVNRRGCKIESIGLSQQQLEKLAPQCRLRETETYGQMFDRIEKQFKEVVFFACLRPLKGYN